MMCFQSYWIQLKNGTRVFWKRFSFSRKCFQLSSEQLWATCSSMCMSLIELLKIENGQKINFHFFGIIENWTKMKWTFSYTDDNKYKKRKKFKTIFHFKTKIECLFRPTASVYISSIHFSIAFSDWKLIFTSILNSI